MTQQVRKGYRNHKKGAWAAVLVVLVAAALAIVLPAMGFPDGSALPPPSEKGVTPTVVNVGGSNFSCTTSMNGIGPSVVGPPSMSTFKVSNPPSSATSVTFDSTNTAGTATPLPAGVTFTLTGVGGKDKGKYFAISASGARVYHVGVNGGNDTAWYNYPAYRDGSLKALYTNGVDADANLHATQKTLGDATTMYTASHTTLCYMPVVKIEGSVYRDADGGGTGDSLLTTPAHQVTLSDGTTSTTISTTAGKYSFLVPTGGDYTVCMAALGGELQTKPNAGTACSSVAGYTFTDIASDSSLNDFAFTGGVTANCDADGGDVLTSQHNSGKATIVAKFYGASCKANGKQFVFTTYNDATSRVAKLSPLTSLGSDDCVPGTGANCQVVAQKITWDLAGDSPDLKTLSYDDTAEGGSSGVMKFCLKDPFNRSASDGVTLLLGPDYMPDDILPGTETTCLARTTQGVFLVDVGGTPTWVKQRVDDVYSAYDGKISFG